MFVVSRKKFSAFSCIGNCVLLGPFGQAGDSFGGPVWAPDGSLRSLSRTS